MPCDQIIPAGFGLPECGVLGAQYSPDAAGLTRRLQCAIGAGDGEPVYLQAIEDPSIWVEIPWDQYAQTVASDGTVRSTPFTDRGGENDVSVRLANGDFARADAGAVITLLLGE